MTVLSTLGLDDESQWTYVDSKGNRYTPKREISNQGTITEAKNTSAPVRAINDYVREYKYNMKNGRVPRWYHGYPLAAMTAAVPQMLVNPLTTTATMAGGYAGSKAVDFGTKLATGKTWADWVSEKTGLDKEASEMTNPGMLVGNKMPGRDLLPFPIIPSKGSVQMYHGKNFGPFDSNMWNNWGSESLAQLTNKYAVKVPKESTSSLVVDPQSFKHLGWKYRAAVNKKLAANKIPGFEPYEYIGYHTTNGRYVPVFRQKKLTVMGDRTSEGAKFNEEALTDIKNEMNRNRGLWQSWGVSDYGLGHNIGKNAEGVGRLYDANYSREPFTWIQ